MYAANIAASRVPSQGRGSSSSQGGVKFSKKGFFRGFTGDEDSIDDQSRNDSINYDKDDPRRMDETYRVFREISADMSMKKYKHGGPAPFHRESRVTEQVDYIFHVIEVRKDPILMIPLLKLQEHQCTLRHKWSGFEFPYNLIIFLVNAHHDSNLPMEDKTCM